MFNYFYNQNQKSTWSIWIENKKLLIVQVYLLILLSSYNTIRETVKKEYENNILVAYNTKSP